MANAEAQRQAVIEPGVSKVEIATLVEAIHQLLIAFVSASMAEAYQVQGCRRCQFESVVTLYPLRKLVRQLDVPADMVLKPFHAIMANHEP